MVSWFTQVKINPLVSSFTQVKINPFVSLFTQVKINLEDKLFVSSFTQVKINLFVSSFTQVKINEVWGTVCDDGFQDNQNAIVACRSLGLTGGEARKKAFFGEGTGLPIHMDDVNCIGNEHTLGDCLYVSDSLANTGAVNCRHNEDVGIICGPPASTVPTATSHRLPPTPTTSSVTMETVTTGTTANTTSTMTTATESGIDASKVVLLASLGGVGLLALVLCGTCLGVMAIRKNGRQAAALPETKRVSVIRIPSVHGMQQFQVIEAHEMSSGHELSSGYTSSHGGFSVSGAEPSSSVYVVEESVVRNY